MASAASGRQHLSAAILSKLRGACFSRNTAQLAQLVDTYDPPITDLAEGFCTAIVRDNLDVMRYLIEKGFPIRAAEIKHAVRTRSYAALEIFREYGWRDVDMNLGEGLDACTALDLAADDPPVLAYLLGCGADPNVGPRATYMSTAERMRMVPNSGSTLRSAVMRRNLESIDLLVSYGAKVTETGVMHTAVISGSIRVMALMLELGAEVDEKDDMFKTGYPAYGTPLLRAIKTGQIDTVHFLLEKGADVTKPGHDGFTPLQIVRMECCGGLGVCRIHWKPIQPEIVQLIETAVKKVTRDDK